MPDETPEAEIRATIKRIEQHLDSLSKHLDEMKDILDLSKPLPKPDPTSERIMDEYVAEHGDLMRRLADR